MYNKLFTKILDSTIWLAPDAHRLVWITLIAAMDQDGVAEFASVQNLALRARVSLDETRAAVRAFESPDELDPGQEFEGRRIEKISGGWLVLNAGKYREIVSRAVKSEKSKARMKAKRDRDRLEELKKKHIDAENVTLSLRPVTPSDQMQDQSSAYANAESEQTLGGGEEGSGGKLGNLPAVSPDEIWRVQQEKIAKAIAAQPEWDDRQIATILLPQSGITKEMVERARRDIRARARNGTSQQP